jgi:uncharacterized membrane protein YidH (DUF202 family)
VGVAIKDSAEKPSKAKQIFQRLGFLIFGIAIVDIAFYGSIEVRNFIVNEFKGNIVSLIVTFLTLVFATIDIIRLIKSKSFTTFSP